MDAIVDGGGADRDFGRELLVAIVDGGGGGAGRDF